MPSIPPTIPEIGSTHRPLRANPSFDPRSSSSLTTKDYYVFSRIDGATSLRDLVLMVGFAPDETIAIVRKLRQVGALLGDGGAPPPRAVTPSAVADGVPEVASPEVTGAWTLRDRGSSSAPPEPSGDDASLTDEERRALREPAEISAQDRRRIIEMRRVIARGDYFEILGVGEGAGKREIKRAYFSLSKEFHPDRFYGVDMGSFGPWLSEIFEGVSGAYAVLSSPKKRAAYEANLRGEAKEQTPEEHAEELFRRGCELEARGELGEALKLFHASIRVRPALATLRRAAACGLRAERLDVAERYAERAAELRPEDASLQRLLAAVCRATGKLARAEQILVRALEFKGASDVLASELAADLERVRRQRAQTGDSA